MKQKDRLYKIYKRNIDENINNQYKIYRNQIVTLITNLKQEYYKNLIEQNKNNSLKNYGKQLITIIILAKQKVMSSKKS